MSVDTREYCDCCRTDVTNGWKDGKKGITVHLRRHVSRNLFRWPGSKDSDHGWDAICGDCWNAIGAAVREAREGSGASA